jgi:hypothetical protein
MNTILKPLFLCVISVYLILITRATAQQTESASQNLILSASVGKGNVLATNPFVTGDNLQQKPITNFRFISVKALWQNPGYKVWQRQYKSPYYGAGISFGDFFNKEEVGTPVSAYGILGIPIKRWNKVSCYTEFQFGLASNWKHYDSVYNPKNIVIGGNLTLHLDIGFKVFAHLSPFVDFGGGISFIHFSNGGFERPNRGFNLLSPYAELRYRFAGRPDYRQIPRPATRNTSRELYFMLGYGNHQLVEHELDSNYFAISGISIIGFQNFSNSFRLGTGLDINYWFGLNARSDGTIGPRTLGNFTLGLLLQPEMVIDRLTIVGGVGIYALHLKHGNFHQTYQRLGVRFNVFDNFSCGVNVRSINFMLAEFMEFNIGYTLKPNRN